MTTSAWWVLAVTAGAAVALGAAAPAAPVAAPTIPLDKLLGKPSEPVKREPTDKDKEHVETVAEGAHKYVVHFTGTVDGTMTRDYAGYQAPRLGFQPNQFVRMENVGTTDVVNPWILVNGKRDWRTVEALVAEGTRGLTTDAEKAWGLYWQQIRNHFHACTWDHEVWDPVKVMNVYGYTLCGDQAAMMPALYKAAGIRVQTLQTAFHMFNNIFYDGGWHCFDADQRVVCLAPDNKTVPGYDELVEDHDPLKGAHEYGLLWADEPWRDAWIAASYWAKAKRTDQPDRPPYTMALTLRPGEALEWRWDHVGKHYTAATPGVAGGETALNMGWGPTAWAMLCNGRLRYAPPLDKPYAAAGLHAKQNLALGGTPALRPEKAGAASATWQLTSPYVMVGGKVTLDGLVLGPKDRAAVSFSTDDKTWVTLWTTEGQGAAAQEVRLDGFLSLPKQPNYTCFVRLELQAEDPAKAGVTGVTLETDLQMARYSLPELELGVNGDNQVEYTDATQGPRQVKITHAWIERTTLKVPAAPAKALQPADGGTVEGTQVTFKWAPPAGLAAKDVADYQIEICDRADLRWPMSPNYEKLVSLTSWKGKAEWGLARRGMLNPDQDYWWHVRAKNSQGVWGPWSAAWKFRCAAPGVPLEPKVEAEAGKGTVKLTWKANPAGRAAVAYKVYGSDMKGFTASDAPYKEYMGRGFCATDADFNKTDIKDGSEQAWQACPSNLVTTTKGTELVLPAPVRAYYRVAAVDEKRVESGVTVNVAVPAGCIFSQPVATATVGQAYKYAVGVVRSDGDLGSGPTVGQMKIAFWDRETVKVTLAEGPKWLSVDANGVLTGTPAAGDVGEHPVVLKVETSRGGKTEQSFRLRVQK